MNGLLHNISMGDVIEVPFPHMVVENVLEPEAYRGVLEYWPPLEIMTHAPSNLANRNWIYAYGQDPFGVDAHFNRLPMNGAVSFWLALGERLADELVKHAFFSKFGLPMEASSFCTVRVITDEQGYSIARHPDGETKVLSALFYCPEDARHPEWGTSIDRKTVPFLPNYMFAFVKTDDSFHWVDEITQEGAKRNQVLLVYEK